MADGVVTAVANGIATITAYCGDYSASCAVSVSGMSEVVACTGITLDQTEMTFDGEGTQTITVTVTPSDTTDTVVWVSSAPAVASISVDGNVCTVQSVSNGNAVITVTCGERSATCSVSISGIDSGGSENTDNIMDGVQWHYGHFNATNGANLDDNTAIMTDAFDVSDYVGFTMLCTIDGTVAVMSQKLGFWDAGGAWLSGTYTDTNKFVADVPESAQTAKVSMKAAATKWSIRIMDTATDEIDISAVEENVGAYYDLNNGNVSTNAGFNSRKVIIDGYYKILTTNVKSGAFYDAENKFVGGIAYNSTTERQIDVPENAVYVGFNYTNGTVPAISACRYVDKGLIGWSEPTEIV